MANVIKIKAGSGVPTTSNIVDRELAFNRSNNKLYINDSGTIVDLSGTAGGGSADEADRIVFTAQAGEALSKGDVIYISGISGNTPIVSKADADDSAKMPAFGLASASASINTTVEIVTFGTLENFDTSAFSVGDTVYVSTTAGALTATKPTGESGLIQNMGHIVRSHASTGAIKIVGAGRTAATPNLNQDKIFLGNASNQSTPTALSSIGLSKFNNDSGFTTNTGDIEGVTAGTGLSGGGTSGTVTLSHADTSSQASVDNSGRTYIQDITLDTYGHVTAISSATETVTDTDTTYSAGSGLDLTGTTFSVDVSDFMSNGSDNRILTATGTDAMNAESNLTFSGGVLSIDNDDVNEGGQISLLPGTGHTSTYHIDNFYGHLRFFSSATAGEQFRLTSGGDLAQLTGTKHYFDGVGHTYIQESSDDILKFYVGGVNLLSMIEGGTNVVKVGDGTYLGAGDSTDLYMYHTSGASFINNGTGMFTIRNQASNQDIRFSVNDGGVTSNILTLNAASSRVGIGTTSPGALLDVAGDGKIQNDLWISTDLGELQFGAGKDGRLYSYNDDLYIDNQTLNQDIHLRVNDGGVYTTALFIDGDTSRVGIGTTSPLAKLHIESGTSTDTALMLKVQYDTSGGDRGKIQWRDGANITGSIHTEYDGTDVSMHFGSLYNSGYNTTTRMVLTGQGNVGIGTTSPTGKLDVVPDTDGYSRIGRARVGYVGFADYAGFSHIDRANVSQYAMIQQSDGATFINSASGTPIYFRESNATKMILTGGNVGIGTTSPQTKLEVKTAKDNINTILSAPLATIGNTTPYLNYQDLEFRNNYANTTGTAKVRLRHHSNLYVNSGSQFSIATSTTGGTITEALRVDHSQNVGIGTTSPAHKLDVNGGIRNYANGSAVFRTESTAAGYGAYNKLITTTNTYDVYALNGDFKIDENGVATRFVIKDTTGNVGIGETNPSALLTIKNTGSGGTTTLKLEDNAREMYLGRDSIKVTTLDGSTAATMYINYPGGNCIFGGTITTGGQLAINDTNAILYRNSNDLELKTYSGYDINLMPAGNVGIGTTSPAYTLDVAGNIALKNNSTYLYFKDASGTNFRGMGINSINNFYVGPIDSFAGGFMLYGASANTSGHVWYSGNAEAMRIDSSQRVGIGTSSPSFKLKVNVDNGTYTDWETIAGFQSKRSADSETEAGIMINSLGDALGGQISSNWYWTDNVGTRGNTGRSAGIFGISNSTTTNSEFYWQTTPHNSNTVTTRMELDGATSTLHVDGDVVAYSTTVSDKRLKDNVETIDNALGKVMKLRGVEFDWNATSRKGQHDIGLIAQEVEEVIPEIVREKEFKVGEFTDNKQTFKTVDYDKMVGVLIEAVKELKTEINELKEKLNG